MHLPAPPAPAASALAGAPATVRSYTPRPQPLLRSFPARCRCRRPPRPPAPPCSAPFQLVGRIESNQMLLQKCNTAALSNILESCVLQGGIAMAESITEKMMKLKPESSLRYIVLARSCGGRSMVSSQNHNLLADIQVVHAIGCSLS